MRSKNFWFKDKEDEIKQPFLFFNYPIILYFNTFFKIMNFPIIKKYLEFLSLK